MDEREHDPDARDGRPTLVDTVHDAPTAALGRRGARDGDAEMPTLPARFEALGLLGQGGMGTVVLARDRRLAREVAVKELARHSDDQTRLRFAREAQLLATLDHPGIVRVFDVAPDGSWIVMERVRGESLSRRLARVGTLSPRDVRRLGVALLDALAATHAAGIVHRDVKPSNILFDEGDAVRLVDFGVAASRDHALTATRAVVGTPCYMPPEQLRGAAVDARADVYAAGATLFEAATGRRLHRPERARDPGRAVRLATGDAALARAVARAVEERPEDRFPGAAAFAAALASRRPRWPRHAAAGVGMVLALGVAAMVLDVAPARSAVPLAPPEATIAIAPFVVDARGERAYAPAGLAHVLGRALARVDDRLVIGHDRMSDVVGDPAAPAAHWRQAAATLGAGVVIEGHVAGSAGQPVVVLRAVGLDGEVFAEQRRAATPDTLPAVVRALVPALVSTLRGRPVAEAPAPSPRFDVEHGLLVGVAAIDHGDPWAILDAAARLELAVRADPGLAEARLYLALAAWLTDGQGPDPVTSIERALADDLPVLDRALLLALRRLVANDHAGAIADLLALAARHPHHRWIQLALVEALDRGGFPDAAVAWYRRAFPAARFGVGAIHVLMHAMRRGDAEAARWALARIVTPTGEPDPVLQVRALVAARDYAGARAAIADGVAAEHGYLPALRFDGAVIDALTGDLEHAQAEARALREQFAGDPPPDVAELLWALALAAGDADARQRWRDATRAHVALADGETGVALRWAIRTMEPASADLVIAAPTPGRLAADPWYQVVRLLVDGGPPPTTTHPWVRAVARALAAEQDGRDSEAVVAWRDALAASSADLAITQTFRLAGALRRLGDADGVIAACDDVIRPRVFDPTWGAAVGPCLLWSGEAAVAAGRRDEAGRYFAQLVALRRRAERDDALVGAARDGLASLGR